MTLKTRKPTGKPSWPMLLLAGREGAGKSYAAATASASDKVGRTLWIGIGEDDPDEYGLIPGARFEIVEHDGSYKGILGALRDAVSEPAGDRPNLIVADSMTRLWNLISDNAQGIANQRANGRRNQATGDFTVTPDLWNAAAAQWSAVMDALRVHQGPSILTARLDEVAVMEKGTPTGEKTWKVQGHKSLPYDVGATIEMRERGKFLITKVKSARTPLEKPRPYPDFTVERLWADLGVEVGTVGERSHATVRTDDEGSVVDALAKWTALAKAETTLEGLRSVWNRAKSEGVDTSVLDAITAIAGTIQEPVADAGEPAPPRDWVKEANGLDTADAVQRLTVEAEASGAPKRVLDALAKRWEQVRAGEAPAAPEVSEWPVAEIPKGDAVEGATESETSR